MVFTLFCPKSNVTNLRVFCAIFFGEKSALVLIFTLFESLYPPHQSQFLRYNQIGTEGGLMRTAIVLGCYRHVCVRPSKEAAVARIKAVAETDYR